MKEYFGRVIALCLLALGCASTAEAQTHGRWLCTSCNLTRYAELLGLQPKQAIPAHDQVVVFIASVVNTRVSQWRAGESVAVCDKSTCVVAVYSGSVFVVWQFLATMPDSGPPYQNGDGNSISSIYGGEWWEGFGQLGYGYYSFNLWLYASPDPPYQGIVIPGPLTPLYETLSGVYVGGGGLCPVSGCPILESIPGVSF